MINALIVDDESIIRNGLTNSIPWKDFGIKIVDSVESADLALDVIKNNVIDLLITDIKMPGKTGFDLISEISNNGFTPQIIIISSYNDFEYAQKACSFDFICGYILKPFDNKQFEEVINVAIKRIKERTSGSPHVFSQDAYILLLNSLDTEGYNKHIFVEKIIENDMEYTLTTWIRIQKVLERHIINDYPVVARFCYNLLDFIGKMIESSKTGVCEYLEKNPCLKEELYTLSSQNDLFGYMRKQISQICENTHSISDICKTKFILTALSRIKLDYANPAFSLAYLSNELKVTPNYLSQKFHDEIGETFSKYLTHYRMEKAKKLLESPICRVSEVAESVGYLDEKYFIRVFKNHTGVTPKKYQMDI